MMNKKSYLPTVKKKNILTLKQMKMMQNHITLLIHTFNLKENNQNIEKEVTIKLEHTLQSSLIITQNQVKLRIS